MQLTATECDIGIYRKRGCCGGRLSLEKILLLVVILTIATANAANVHRREEAESSTLAATAITPTTATTPGIANNDDICVTPGCVAAAARVNEYINPSIHPCDNFFEYACGSWIKRHPIPEDRSMIDIFGMVKDRVEVILKDLLERTSSEQEDNDIKKARKLYASCMNESQIEERGLEPLQFLYDTMSPWPLLNSSWDNTSFDLIQLLMDVQKYGYVPLFHFGDDDDLKNSSAKILAIGPGALIMPGSHYYNMTITPKGIPTLTTYIGSLAEALGGTKVTEKVKELVEFERKVAELIMSEEGRRDATKRYNKMTISELSTKISAKFNWTRYVTGIMNISGIPIDGDEPVVVSNPVYLRNLMDLLGETSYETIANYIMSYVLHNVVQWMPRNIRDLQTEFKRELGLQPARARWRSCVQQTRKYMSDAVDAMFIDAEFDEDAKAIASSMVADIRTSFIELLKNNDWLDDTTRRVAEEKAETIVEKIGYPDEDVENDTNPEEIYKDVDFSSDQYLENLLKARKWIVIESLKLLRDIVRKDEWFMSSTDVNAQYHPSFNDITVPAASLQPPFFSKHFPKSINFGGIGYFIGHEITHAFDDQGRQFDKDGNLKDWWTENAIRKFKTKAQCIVDQYSRYFVPKANMHLNGINTQGENIADNGGLKQSFTAYRDWVRTQGKEEPKLPGVELSHSQLFFVNFAQSWCTTMRRGYAVYSIFNDLHSPGRFRVIGTLQNSLEFSEVFNCSHTSYMNPKDKCRVW